MRTWNTIRRVGRQGQGTCAKIEAHRFVSEAFTWRGFFKKRERYCEKRNCYRVNKSNGLA